MDSLSVFHLSSALIWVAAILTTGGVIVLRPLAKELAEYLEALVEEKQRLAPDNERVVELLAGMDERLSRLEDGLAVQRRLPPSEGGSGEASGSARR